MSALPDGEYLLTDVQWRRRDENEALRPLHGFTTGRLVVSGGDGDLSARFSDQFLSNRISDLEEDEVPVVFHITVLEADETFELSCSAPALDRSGASYCVSGQGGLDVVGSKAPA